MRISRGDVYWLAEGKRRRPVAVLSRETALPLLSWITVVPATTTIRSIPTEVALGPEDGMPSACVLTLDNIRVVPKRALKGRITGLSAARMDEVCSALRYALGC